MDVTKHRAHDYRFLIQRWRALARKGGLIMRRFAEVGGYPVYFLKTKRLPKTGAIYISTGIHGDEPAGPEACLAWAEKNVRLFAQHPFIIFPCLNPWGLVNNSRNDDLRRDLNRLFQDDKIAALRALKELIKPMHFPLALMLHEDFDGQGLYLYEVQKLKPHWGEGLLKAARKIIPIDPRPRVDGRPFRNGVFRRKITLRVFKKMGLPEAPYLHLHHADRTFTIETPSEFALDRRVRAQVAIIEESVRRVHASREK